jgi:hypothetical protein
MREDELPGDDDEMLPEYDLTGAVRGKYAGRLDPGALMVSIDSDLVKIFPDAGAVNRALRALADMIQEHRPAPGGAATTAGEQSRAG